MSHVAVNYSVCGLSHTVDTSCKATTTRLNKRRSTTDISTNVYSCQTNIHLKLPFHILSCYKNWRLKNDKFSCLQILILRRISVMFFFCPCLLGIQLFIELIHKRSTYSVNVYLFKLVLILIFTTAFRFYNRI